MVKIPKRHEVCRKFKEQGGKVAAVLPIHYPRALLRAFDILPVEVWGPPQVDVSYGGAHLQPYVCSIVHNALSFLKTGGLDETDLIIVPHTCDSLQGFGSILLDFVKPRQPVFPVYLPRGKRQEDVEFLVNEFKSLYRGLEKITGKSPKTDEILKRIEIEEKADAKLKELYEIRGEFSFESGKAKSRSSKGDALSTYDFYRVVRAREFLPVEEFIELADEVISEYSFVREGVPVILSGIVPEPMEVLNAIEEAGGFVVADDLACCGRRLYGGGKSSEPLKRMAERIIFGPPDVTRGNLIEERFEHLKYLAEVTGARGIIFYTVKFCEPELFDLPDLKNMLKSAGIPSVQVEIDIGDPLPHQTITRLTAFLEVLA